MIEREELDLDRLEAEAASAAAEADAVLDRLAGVDLGDGRGRVVRTLDERRQAVLEVVEAVTPPRYVRSPAERREAVQAVLEEREREIQRRRAERQSREDAAREAAVRAVRQSGPPPASAPRPLEFPEHPPEVEAVVAATMRDRKPRTPAQRLEDARRAALDELERRRQAREVATPGGA